MNYRLLLMIALVLGAFQVQAIDHDTDNRFYDKSTEHFTATVGKLATRVGYIHFADASIPPSPDPVMMSFGIAANLTDAVPNDGTYTYEIEGADASMFGAMITSMSSQENGCTVRIIYHPTQVGTHTARLNVYCETAGAPLTYINLSGEAIARPGDLDGDGKLGVNDVSSLIDMILSVE